MLLTGLLFGVLAACSYIIPGIWKETLGFIQLRPLHVSFILFWILLGATGSVYCGMTLYSNQTVSKKIAYFQWALWLTAIAGITGSYFSKTFGGREYWEFPPLGALPVALAWLLFLFNLSGILKRLHNWPVYVWMWCTGLVFFLFSFIESYLWVFPYFSEWFVRDMTIQWKANGSLIGSWNQLLYGTAIFLMERISKDPKVSRSHLAFGLYLLGLFNLMFNWGHHIYTLPAEMSVRYVGYIVSMTEWVILLRIIYLWKRSLNQAQKLFHHVPYRFLLATDVWIFLNLIQALLMSIPAINLYTHGTHVTVAHAMGTTIGINSMILLAACFEFFNVKLKNLSGFNLAYILIQSGLLVFWISLLGAGIQKGIWQMQHHQIPFASMMHELRGWFHIFFFSGCILMLSISYMAVILLKQYLKSVKW